MRTDLRVAVLTLACMVIAAAPVATTRYSVTMTEREAGPGSERGTLVLRIPPQGSITGTYRDFDGNGPYPVAGGRQNDAIWLDYRNVHVTATIGPKGIDGRAFRGGGSEEYVFHALLIR